MSTEREYAFDLTIGETRKIRYRTMAASEDEARKRAEAFAGRMARGQLGTPRGESADGVYMNRFHRTR